MSKNMADLLNYFQKEATRGASAAAARDWLLKITSLDNATAESQARLAQSLKDESAAKDRLAQLLQEQQDAAAASDTVRRRAAEESAAMRAQADRDNETAADQSRQIVVDAGKRSDEIVAAANVQAAKIRSDMTDSLTGLKDDIAQATIARDAVLAEVKSAKTQLDEYNAASRAILARVQR